MSTNSVRNIGRRGGKGVGHSEAGTIVGQPGAVCQPGAGTIVAKIMAVSAVVKLEAKETGFK